MMLLPNFMIRGWAPGVPEENQQDKVPYHPLHSQQLPSPVMIVILKAKSRQKSNVNEQCTQQRLREYTNTATLITTIISMKTLYYHFCYIFLINSLYFRFNLAPTAGFEDDVGKKTNITTMNQSILKRYPLGQVSIDYSLVTCPLVQCDQIWT